MTVQDLVQGIDHENILALLRPKGDIESFAAIFERKLQNVLQPKLQSKCELRTGELLSVMPSKGGKGRSAGNGTATPNGGRSLHRQPPGAAGRDATPDGDRVTVPLGVRSH